MVTLDNWRARMSEDMRLRDLRPRTHEAYLASVRQFMDRVGKAPEALTDEDVRGYFLYLREDRKLAPSSIHLAVVCRIASRIAHAGILHPRPRARTAQLASRPRGRGMSPRPELVERRPGVERECFARRLGNRLIFDTTRVIRRAPLRPRRVGRLRIALRAETGARLETTEPAVVFINSP